jgi:hypothetical protein
MTDMMTTIELDDDFELNDDHNTQSANNQSQSNPTNNTNEITSINHTIPTEQEKNELFEAISDDSFLTEPDLSEDNLVETEDDSNGSKWSKSKYTQTIIIAVVLGVVALVGAGAFGLFSFLTQPNISRNVTDTDNAELDEDPTQDAITEAENSKAQLILLGDSSNQPPPKQKIEDAQTQTQTASTGPTSTTSTPTSSSTAPTTVPTTPQRVSTPPSPRRTSSEPRPSRPPVSTSRVTSPRTQQSTIATQPEKKVIDRQALSERGWSGFAQMAQNLTKPQSEPSPESPSQTGSSESPSQTGSSQTPTPNTQPTEPIPVIRLVMGDSSSNPHWQFQTEKEQTSSQTQDGDSTSNSTSSPTRQNTQISSNSVQAIKLNNPPNISTLLATNKLSLTQTSQQNNPELPLKSQDNLNHLHSQLPQTFPLGTQLHGELTTPIVHTLKSNANNNNNNNADSTFTYPFSIVITQDLLTPSGKTALPAGTLMMGRVVALTPSGMIHAEITSISYKKLGQQFNLSVPSGQILVLSENSQPLKAQRLNDPSAAIASQDFLVGTLGAAATGLEYANQPQTETNIQQNGFGGFNSSSTTTNQDVGLIPGLAEGFFNTLKGRMESRADTAITEYQRQVPEYYVPANTKVTLFFNAVLEIVP